MLLSALSVLSLLVPAMGDLPGFGVLLSQNPGRASRCRIFSVIISLFICTPGFAAECLDESYQGNSYTRCKVDVSSEQMSLFLYQSDGVPFGYFESLKRTLLANGQRLVFAMNAGMYHDDRSPVGHYRENGIKIKNIIPNAGPGNFGLLPNGVFCIQDGRADVFETLDFVERKPDCLHATQSGPMLVINGALHPRFLPNSENRYIRNGVGTTIDGKFAYFVISNNSVTFHDFGSYFRDRLHLKQALYFDGNVSRMYAPAHNRSDFSFSALGPIVGVVVTE